MLPISQESNLRKQKLLKFIKTIRGNDEIWEGVPCKSIDKYMHEKFCMNIFCYDLKFICHR